MKILFISDVYFPRINGVSTSIRTFVHEFQALGHHVDLIAPDYGITTADEHWIKRIPARGIYFDPEDKLMRYGQALDRLIELRRANYDLIHIHTPFVAHYLGLKLAHLLDVPVVETYHTFFEDYLHHYLPWLPSGFSRSFARFVSRRQCNAVDAIIAPSQPMLDVLRAYGVKTLAEVVPTGLQTHSFVQGDGARFREQHGITAERPLLLYVGRVAFEKSIDFLLHMVDVLRKQQPEVLLVIAGEGPAEASLHALSEQLGLQANVMFIGYLDREKELNSCYHAADIFVFASRSETQGLVLLEAMAQAVPVVAIAELGTRSILVEGQGAHIAEADVHQFAGRVHELLQDHQERVALGQAAHHYASKHWTSRAQALRMLQLYQRLIEPRSNFPD
ncbi:glycosyltransferase [Methylobacillus flagellatus]|uniref:glycosyltransferase n=1 Tax=Methylobacillus flagellatus TaxID=405 RepID=UPI0010F67BF0|nr:glycosyltransferase [Methylobacillus flagellatus]